MKEFKGRVAVVTGGAGGIGLAMARKFAEAGMKLVLADIEEPTLDKVVHEFKANGVEAIGVVTDVGNAVAMQNLADKTYETYGAAHIICNNAGVASAGLCWERSIYDWEWVLGVNLWGVIHGIRLFVPRMLAGGEEGHIVNTASLAGMTSAPGMATYNVSKHGVVTLTETLYHELVMIKSKLRCSVLCPAWVKTGIADSERNRPDHFRSVGDDKPDQVRDMLEGSVRKLLEEGRTPEVIADAVFEAIEEEKVYILTHPELDAQVKDRFDRILARENPVFTGIT